MNPAGIDANESVAYRSSGQLRLMRLRQYAIAILCVGVALGASLVLEHFHFRGPSAMLLLFAVAISSWFGGPGPSLLAFILSTIGFYWYFVEPVRTIYIYRSEIPVFIIFTAFAALLSWFGTVRRRGEAHLREQAALLNLTHDTVFVMDMEGMIKYWNRGAEQQYGWTAEQAVGKVVHDLLKTVFPAALEEIKAELMRAGRWEGEVLHTRKDGSQLVAASRWSLERGKQSEPVAILETNNDITERKRAEETLRHLNRELRAISNCNQVLLRATDEQSLLERICRIVCEEAGYRMAWVGYAEHDEAKSVRPVAWTGAEEGYLASAGITWADTERGRGLAGTAIRSGKSCCIQDFATDLRLAPWREGLWQRGFRSGIALPLKDEHANTFGSLSIYSAQPNALTSEESRLLEELAGDMAFGIVTLRSRASRKQAEEALRRSEAYLAEAQRLSHSGSFAFDVASNKYLYISEECFRIFELDPQRSLPSREAVSRLIHPDDWSRVQADFDKLLRDKVDTPSMFRIVLPGGAVKHIQVIRHPELNSAREVVTIVGTAMDITERKLANAYNRGLIESSLDPLVTIGPDGKITDVNLATESATGRSRGELIGTDFCDYFTEPANARAGYEQVFREGLVRDYPLELRHRNGHVMSVSYNAAIYRNESGEVVGAFAAARDITERKRAEEALRRSEAYLAEAEKMSHSGSWALSPEMEIQYWSKECYRIMGFDPAEGLPRIEKFLERVHPDDLPGVRDLLHRISRDRVPYEVEYRIVRPGGDIRDLHIIGRPVFDTAGVLVEYVGTTTDVTERKRSEESLRRSEAYLSEAQRLTHTGAWAGDPNTTAPLYWSEEVFQMFGFDPQQGLPTWDQPLQRIHPEDRDKFWQALQSAIHEKVESDCEYRIVLPDGTVKHAYGTARPVLDANGEVVELVGSTVDITVRKRAEEALRESETRFRTFVDHAADAFFMLDFEQRIIIDANQAACDSLGFTRQELIGQTPLAFHLDSYSAEMKLLAERAATGESVFDRHLHRRKDGSLFPVEVHTNAISYDGHRFLLKVARDISDRVRAEEQRDKLRQLEAEIAHLDRVTMLGELTASIAHEVNQPLSGVVSNGSACLRWLAGEVPNMEEAREAARRIVRDGKRAADVVARVRAMTKRTEASREKLDVNETIRDVLALVGDEAKKNRVLIRTEFADDVFPILGDRVQLQQVVLNLVMNGMEAMSNVSENARELAITTRNVDPNQVQVTVQDSGKGLDPDTMPKIFDPFYTTKPHGMGMGLSISRSILQAHGGQLWAAANDGPGTSFHFTLPRYGEKSDAAA